MIVLTIRATSKHAYLFPCCFREHYQVADTLRTFLELDQPSHQVQDTDDYLGDGSSSEDSFEQVDHGDLESCPEQATPSDLATQ